MYLLTTLTQTDSGKQTILNPGDVVVVSLDETPSTGYCWTLVGDSSKVLRLLDSRYAAPAAEKPGATGVH